MALLPVAEALARILDGVEPLPAQEQPLAEALDRVLAQDLVALRTQPPAAMSAMDGYAVRGADVAHVPARLKVVGEAAAGQPFTGHVRSGETARIFTGGVMPEGTDTVVIQENTERNGEFIAVKSATVTGRNVRREGLDFRTGDRLLRKGTRLNERALMLAAAMNYPNVPVHRRPRVAVLSTGDELVFPGAELKAGQIVYSNGFALSALATQEGADVIELGIARDQVEAIAAAVTRAKSAQADVLLTSGGASVGDHDLVQKALASEGLELSFWRIAMRPGRPMMYGVLNGMRVLGVPGNPVSSFVCSFLFLPPLLRRLSGHSDVEHRTTTATLGRDLPANDERADYLRAALTENADGSLTAHPMQQQDSSMMANLAKADCLLIREPFAPAASAGSDCVILKLRL